jgi:DNA polymerase elongation subunit (family B)
MDKKLKFMDLANTTAHGCTVLLPTTLGSVAAIEQAIINEAHSKGQIAPNRKPRNDNENTQAAGAYVAYPKKGLHDWVASLDINSLYPSTIRALNMSPETIIGQLRPVATDKFIADQMATGKKFASCWEGVFSTLEYDDVMSRDSNRMLTIDWEEGSSDELSAAQTYDLIFKSGQSWMLSANGTIFTFEKEGIVPGLLKKWYADRQGMQAKMKIARDAGLDIEERYWSIKEQFCKLLLNSLYGALLNSGCRFFDKRIGQSTTLTGRSITRHMTAQVNEIVCGEYNYLGKSILYNDTDSLESGSIIRTTSGDLTIEELFNRGNLKWNSGDKEYSRDDDIQVIHCDGTDRLSYTNYNYVYRHKVSKRRFKIMTANGKTVTVTEDHSVMIKTDAGYIEKKPMDIKPGDIVMTINTV